MILAVDGCGTFRVPSGVAAVDGKCTCCKYCLDGLPLDDVARALEVGFETAKTRLRYAMSKLRTCMGAYLAPFQDAGGAR